MLIKALFDCPQSRLGLHSPDYLASLIQAAVLPLTQITCSLSNQTWIYIQPWVAKGILVVVSMVQNPNEYHQGADLAD